ncbi:MAG: alpha/beta hydrolase [Hyphomonadaceae bacterium]|jgi:acetyl esterase/lipase|nr:alpha/beta hydrolase [Hyphomonadaceae bacterium]
MRRFLFAFAALATALTGACRGPELLNAAARDAGVVQTDLAYGPLPRHRYDVYTPHTLTPDTPVLLFIHGGSWQHGVKEQYRFVGAAFAQAGVQAVLVNYRLFPDVIFPDFMDDAALAVAHIKREVAGDRPMLIAGHSAGAQIAALLAGDPRYLAAVGTDICSATSGMIGVAGPYTFTPVAPEFRAIFPPDRLEAARPLNFATGARPPSLLLHGTADTTVLPERSTEYATALTAAGNRAEVKLYPGVNHTLIIGAISPVIRAAAPTFNDMLSFIQAERAAGWPGCNR